MGGEVMNVHRLGVRVAAVLALVLSMASKQPSAMAAEIEVPPDVRAALTLRILEYDRGLLKWAGSSLRVGVVSKGGESAYRKGLSASSSRIHWIGIRCVVPAPSPGEGTSPPISGSRLGALNVIGRDLKADELVFHLPGSS